MEEELIEEQDIENQPKSKETKEDKVARIQPYQWKKGQSGNPAGRPRGKTMKEYARELLMCQTEEERQEFLHGIPKIELWKMCEGLPQQDITSGGEKINPIPIININNNVIPSDNSNKEDNADVKEVENCAGGNVCIQNYINPDILNSIIPDGQNPEDNKHSVRELPAPKEGIGEGLPEHNEGTQVLPRETVG